MSVVQSVTHYQTFTLHHSCFISNSVFFSSPLRAKLSGYPYHAFLSKAKQRLFSDAWSSAVIDQLPWTCECNNHHFIRYALWIALVTEGIIQNIQFRSILNAYDAQRRLPVGLCSACVTTIPHPQFPPLIFLLTNQNTPAMEGKRHSSLSAAASPKTCGKLERPKTSLCSPHARRRRYSFSSPICTARASGTSSQKYQNTQMHGYLSYLSSEHAFHNDILTSAP